MEISFLGAGNAFAESGLLWNGFLVDNDVLFEAPPSALPALKRQGRDPGKIAAIIISHFHGDHFAGLPFLFLEYTYKTPRGDDLTIIGPPGIEERAESLTRNVYTGVALRPAFRRRYIEVSDGGQMPVAGGTLSAFRVVHAPDLQAFGYRFEREDQVMAYSGDTTLCDALVPLASGADRFIVECASPFAEDGIHLNLRMLRELRNRLGPNPPFLLTHREGETPLDGLENAALAEEGCVYRI